MLPLDIGLSTYAILFMSVVLTGIILVITFGGNPDIVSLIISAIMVGITIFVAGMIFGATAYDTNITVCKITITSDYVFLEDTNGNTYRSGDIMNGINIDVGDNITIIRVHYPLFGDEHMVYRATLTKDIIRCGDVGCKF